MERKKTKDISLKRQRARRRISLSNEEKTNNKNNIGDKINLDQAYNEYLFLN